MTNTEIPKGYRPVYKRSAIRFFIGFFGAIAIIGVFFKIIQWNYWEIFMTVGFMGEAAVFLMMGLMKEMKLERVDRDVETGEEEEGFMSLDGPGQPRRSDPAVQVQLDLPENMQELIEERVRSEMNHLNRELNVVVGRIVDDSRRLGSDMEHLRGSLAGMRLEMEAAAARLRHFNEPVRIGVANGANMMSERAKEAGRR